MERKIKQVLSGSGRENMVHGETEQMSNSELIDCTRESEKLRMREMEWQRCGGWGLQVKKRSVDCRRG